MLLTLSFALLAQAPQAPLAVPTQAPRKPAAQQQGHPVVGFGQSDGGQFGNTSIEAFEAAVIAAGSALQVNSSVLDETPLAADG